MDYLSGKMTVLVGEASSRVNDTRRRWREQKRNNDNKRRQDESFVQDAESLSQQQQQQQASAINMNDSRPQKPWPLARGFSMLDGKYQRPLLLGGSPLGGGTPFGGDSLSSSMFRTPPAIGFRTDLLLAQGNSNNEGKSLSEFNTTTTTTQQPGGKQQAAGENNLNYHSDGGRQAALNDSDESLYKGDAWARLWFQRVMILSLLRLLLFIRKVYEDFHATKVYNLTGQTGHFLIAATTLLLPTLVFTIYRVSRYLQVSLPPLRMLRQAQQASHLAEGEAATSGDDAIRRRAQGAASSSKSGRFGQTDQEEEAQLTRALMSSPVQSITSELPAPRDTPTEQSATPISPQQLDHENIEGLVTARQTPTNLDQDQFHDSRSQQDEATSSNKLESVIIDETQAPKAPSRRASRAAPKLLASAPDGGEGASKSGSGSPAPLESVRIEKLFAADVTTATNRETTRVVTGASEQLLHGLLFIFWQLKRQVDVMGYLVERACLWRRPAEREKDELGRLRTGSDGLEWFQDFYAAFLAILAQVYTLGLHWSTGGDNDAALLKKLSASQVAAATGNLGGDGPSSGGSSGDLTISNSARAVSQLLSSQALAGNALGGRDVLIMSELIVSTAVVLSLLIAVRRRDDGPLTLGLSMLGWGSLFAARIIIIALSFVHLGWHLMLPLVICHVLLVAGWIYSIAIASHNDSPGERLDEAKWDEETAVEIGSQQLELEEVKTTGEIDASQQEFAATKLEFKANATSRWSWMEHIVLLAQILSLFAIPSLFYWPIMFNLKLHFRPFKYLCVILLENFLLITAIWFSISSAAAATAGQLYLLGFVGGFSIFGFLFIALYIMCKPSLTEYFARADELFNEAEKSGIYYEFCSRVFKMPDLSKQTFRRLMNQSEVVEEIQEEAEE